MKVALLGTGAYHPNERRHTACVMLPEIGVIFDAGTSFFRVTSRLKTRERVRLELDIPKASCMVLLGTQGASDRSSSCRKLSTDFGNRLNGLGVCHSAGRYDEIGIRRLMPDA